MELDTSGRKGQKLHQSGSLIPCQLLFSCLTFSVYDSGTKVGQFCHPVELPPQAVKGHLPDVPDAGGCEVGRGPAPLQVLPQGLNSTGN